MHRTAWADDGLWLLDRILPGLLDPPGTRSRAPRPVRLLLGATFASTFLAAALIVVLIPAVSRLQRAYLADGIGHAELARSADYLFDRDLLISCGFLGLVTYGLLPNFAILLKTKALMGIVRARYPRLAHRHVFAILILDLFASGLLYLILFPLNIALILPISREARLVEILPTTVARSRDAYAALFDGAYGLGESDWAVSLSVDAVLISWLAVWTFAMLGPVLREPPLHGRDRMEPSDSVPQAPSDGYVPPGKTEHPDAG